LPRKPPHSARKGPAVQTSASGKRGDPVDVTVGQRIRIHRLAKRMSQGDLGASIGVTFQQVQKYEKGVNRVGAGRLTRMAAVLGVPVSAFFPYPESNGDGGDRTELPLEAMTVPGAVRLVQAFAKIDRGDLRSAVVTLVEMMASKDS
jgi:transcriptional regulator with XRE-family HTH domain